MRIVSWNIENLAPYLLHDAVVPLAEVHRRLGTPDVLCLQEVRVRQSDSDLVTRMRSALPGFDCHWSLNHDPVNASYRGGRAYGVATYIRSDFNANALSFPWDREGRLIISGIGSKRIAIGNAYAVNGTDKPYRDMATGTVSGDRHTFKRRFIACFQAKAESLQSAGLRLVLIGDWNVSRSKLDVTPRLRTEGPHAAARAQLNDAFIPQLNLVDVFRERHPNERAFTWISQRAGARLDAARVDYALVDRALGGRVLSVGICESAPHTGSDHRPLWIALEDD